MNAFYISIGTKVKWNNPSIEKFDGEEREHQENRIYEVVDIINEDAVVLEDEYGEVEAYVSELSFVE